MLPNLQYPTLIPRSSSSVPTLHLISRSRPGSHLSSLKLRPCLSKIYFTSFIVLANSRGFFISATSPTFQGASLKSSSSRNFKSTSPASAIHEFHSIQIDPSSLCKPITQTSQWKEADQSQNNVPEYSSSSYPEVYIASDEHTTTDDDADTFTISTFSYYGGAPSPSSPSHRFDLTPSISPLGLSPPPLCPIVKRPVPRDVLSSADSVMTECLSSPSSSVPIPQVPQDVTESLPGRMMMNVPGGILVTVYKEASLDKMV